MLVTNTLLHSYYRIERRIGQGAMGAVYQALDVRNGDLVAIKHVPAGDERLRGALDREARILARLHHPALPHVREHFADAGGWCLVMDFIPGDDLAITTQRASMPPPLADVFRWADQLLDVLEYLHARRPPLIHRDIKPRNLKLSARGELVLLDFGLARGAEARGVADAGVHGYTLAYAPLEQIRGERTGPRSDLYALAATLYDLLTGVPPPSAVQRAVALSDGRPDPLQRADQLAAWVSADLAALLHSALALRPAQRPASAAVMRLALHAASDPRSTSIAMPVLMPARSRPNNLSAQPTPLVGRAEAVAVVGDLLGRSDVRLATLTGTAGIGKTRLGLAVAAQLLRSSRLSDDAGFADGVFFVPLAPIRDPGLVATAITQVLGVKERGDQPLIQSLKDYLRDKQILLLLDNFEQVLPAALLIADLLAAAARLKVLVTSREVLRLRGEHEFPVPPLALPPQEQRTKNQEPRTGTRRVNQEPYSSDLDSVLGSQFSVFSTLAELTRYGAVDLFVRCAQAARLDFALDSLNAPAVVAICHRLDGLPLAIELAATRIRAFAPPDLLARIERRLDLLIDGPRDLPVRQQTLRGAIAWSYDLLDADERRLFAQLGVFTGGWTVEAAEAVCADWRLEIGDYKNPSLISHLQSLTDKNLLLRIEAVDAEARFSMLESIREYALEQLAASGERAAVRQRHADYFLLLAEQVEPKLRSPEQKYWLDVLETEHDNMRSAQTWTFEREAAELTLRLCGALTPFWRSRGYLDEGRRQLRAALALGGAVSARIRAKALAQLGRICFNQSNVIDARTCYEESLALYRDLGDQESIAWMLLDLGSLEQEYAPAQVRFSESLALFRADGNRAGMAAALNQLSDYERWGGDLAMARAYGSESLTQYRELGDRIGLADALRTLGGIAMTQGDVPTARAYLAESATVFDALDEQHGWAWAQSDLGRVLAVDGELAAARICFAQSRALFRIFSDQAGVGWSLYGQGEAELCAGDASAREWLAEALALFRALEEDRGVAWTLTRLGKLAGDHAELELARTYFREGLALHRQAGNKEGIAYIVEGYAGLALVYAQPERAARLCGAAAALRATISIPLRPNERAAHERLIAAIRAGLEGTLFSAAWAAGQAMTVDALGTYALEER